MDNESVILTVLIVISIISLLITLIILSSHKKDKEKKKDKEDKKDNTKYPRTFFIDIDGTIFPNSTIEELDKYDRNNTIQELLPGAKEFFQSLGENDVVIITTGRSERFRRITNLNFKTHNIKYKHLIMALPIGQRFLINDTPNMLYQKAISINLLRDKGFGNVYNFNPTY